MPACTCSNEFGHRSDCALFTCSVCGGPTTIAPQDGPAFCEAHCPDHDYQYDRFEGHRCITCNAEPPADWFDGANERLRRHPVNTWGAVFNHHKRKGCDPSDAAWRADQWEKRQHPNRWKDCPSTHCERSEECRSPNDCCAKTNRRGN